VHLIQLGWLLCTAMSASPSHTAGKYERWRDASSRASRCGEGGAHALHAPPANTPSERTSPPLIVRHADRVTDGRERLGIAPTSAHPPRQAHPFVVDTPQFPHLELLRDDDRRKSGRSVSSRAFRSCRSLSSLRAERFSGSSSISQIALPPPWLDKTRPSRSESRCSRDRLVGTR
jgi:hypothetical protein